MSAARPVRLPRTSSETSTRAVRLPARTPRTEPPPVLAPAELRPNVGATRRAVRLTSLFAVAVAAVFAALALTARTGPNGASGPTVPLLELVAGVAVAVVVAGALFAFGAAPKAVGVGEEVTIVVGRFGRRYRYPGRARLRTVVLQRLPVGLLTPVPLESVEIAGGTHRRSFLVDEGLLPSTDGPETPR